MNSTHIPFDAELLKYLNLLAVQYPNINAASTEIINLQAILNLPKGTEHFVSDVHGAYDSFNHVLRNASGVIKSYIEEIFGNTLRDAAKKSLATLIYYPEAKLKAIQSTEQDMRDWYRITLFRLIRICKRTSSKYSRSKVRKALPKDFAYVLEELLQEEVDTANKQGYYNEIIDTIIRLGRAGDFIVAISNVICHLAIDRLHVIGDIYDRGPSAEKVMDVLQNYHSVDIQWGNHDILWMGAASGSDACICNVIRICARYDNLHTLEEGYGINLVPLATFAMEVYADDPCEIFTVSHKESVDLPDSESWEKEISLLSKMHKAISILQFKVEAQAIKRNPDFEMEDRLMLNKIDYEKHTIQIDGTEYPLTDACFPTVDPSQPLELTNGEKNLMEKLRFSFQNSAKLQEHTRVLFSKGSMYKIFNSNLLFHGCVPLEEDGSLKKVKLRGREYAGREYMDVLDAMVRNGFFHNEDNDRQSEGQDLMWYLWCGPDSPLFGKDRMTTFERHFINEPALYKETSDPYYEKRNEEEACRYILEEFGLDPSKSHIINGHVPVKVIKGEKPVKGGGKLFVIDGGFSKAYQKVTGIAGYTLIYNSHGLVLCSHEPFESADAAIHTEKDIISETMPVEYNQVRIKVEDTDKGIELKNKISDLEALLRAYRKGHIHEQI